MTSALLSGYRLMWMIVLFDLPLATKAQRKAATNFRHALLDLGFEMSQFSVYMRLASGKERVETLVKKVEQYLPAYGKVHIVTITDKQYRNIVTFRGRTRGEAQKNPDQLALF